MTNTVINRMADWRRAAFSNPLFFRALPAGIALAIIDQLSKYWIVHIVELPKRRKIELSNIFDLTYVQNYGASFGLGAGGLVSRVVLSVIVIGVFIGLVTWLGRLTRPIAATGVAFVIGGALGNLYDRVAYGYVVDFLDFSGLHFPWVFNIADISINIGIVFLLLDAWHTRDLPDPGEANDPNRGTQPPERRSDTDLADTNLANTDRE